MSELEDKIAELKSAKPTIIAGADKQEVGEGNPMYEELILSIAKSELEDDFENGVSE
jgi:hypothetical protein